MKRVGSQMGRPGRCPRIVVTGLLVVLVVLAGLRAPALANDTLVGGSGSDLVPLSSSEVQMVSEDIEIRLGETDRGADFLRRGWWHVTARYTFKNHGAAPVEVQVGFPEYVCEEAEQDCDDDPVRFEAMHTTVDGRPVQHRLGNVKKGHPWAPRLGKVWLFDVRFDPGRTTQVVHRYRVREGIVVDGTSLGAYVTRTGATWAKDIAHARFRILIPARSAGFSLYPEDVGLTQRLGLIEEGGKQVGEVVLEARNWEPQADLHFGVVPWIGANFMELPPGLDEKMDGETGCPKLHTLWNHAGHLQHAEKKTAKDLTAAHAADLVADWTGDVRICRNFVFAACGRRFKDDALNRYFYGPKGFVPGTWPFEPFEPNPGYSEALLSTSDWMTLRLIDLVEEGLRGKGEAAGAGRVVASEVQDSTVAVRDDLQSGGDRAATTKPKPQPARSAGGCGCRIAGQNGDPGSGLVGLVSLCAVLPARNRSRARRRREADLAG